jgi:hypothetical protein
MKRAKLRVGLATALVAAGIGLGPAPVEARYFTDQASAEHYVRDFFHNTVGYHYTAASCRPRGRAKADPRYDYHTWTCGFAAGDSRFNASCTGMIRIKGSHTAGQFYEHVLFHRGRCPLGVSG